MDVVGGCYVVSGIVLGRHRPPTKRDDNGNKTKKKCYPYGKNSNTTVQVS